MKLEAPFKLPFCILIIVAHPDDIEFGAGGAAAVWTDAGATVVYCIVTNGAAGSNDPHSDLVELIALRQEEQREAGKHVGVTDIRFLNYPDGALQPTLDLRRELTRLIREVKPNRVMIMDPRTIIVSQDEFDYINHPDHRAAGEAALYAIFPSSETRPIFPELLAEGYEPHHIDEVYLTIANDPNIAVDISNVWDRKIASLLSHRSQLDESVAEMIRTWDAKAGEEVGVPLAETFKVMRFYQDMPGDSVPSDPDATPAS